MIVSIHGDRKILTPFCGVVVLVFLFEVPGPFFTDLCPASALCSAAVINFCKSCCFFSLSFFRSSIFFSSVINISSCSTCGSHDQPLDHVITIIRSHDDAFTCSCVLLYNLSSCSFLLRSCSAS